MEEEQVKPQNDTAFTEDDDDPPTLSSHTLAALKEFLQQQQTITDQTAQTDGEGSETGEKVALIAEDWRLSQFWYDQLTAETVANEVHALLSNPSSLAVCIACPTLYAYIKKIYPSVNVQLLEYDKRFEQYGSDFTFYDYNIPEDLPDQFKHAFQVVVADPPYLSQECLEKVAQTISFLAIPGKSYVLLLTVPQIPSAKPAVEHVSHVQCLGISVSRSPKCPLPCPSLVWFPRSIGRELETVIPISTRLQYSLERRKFSISILQ